MNRPGHNPGSWQRMAQFKWGRDAWHPTIDLDAPLSALEHFERAKLWAQESHVIRVLIVENTGEHDDTEIDVAYVYEDGTIEDLRVSPHWNPLGY